MSFLIKPWKERLPTISLEIERQIIDVKSPSRPGITQGDHRLWQFARLLEPEQHLLDQQYREFDRLFFHFSSELKADIDRKKIEGSISDTLNFNIEHFVSGSFANKTYLKGYSDMDAIFILNSDSPCKIQEVHGERALFMGGTRIGFGIYAALSNAINNAIQQVKFHDLFIKFDLKESFDGFVYTFAGPQVEIDVVPVLISGGIYYFVRQDGKMHPVDIAFSVKSFNALADKRKGLRDIVRCFKLAKQLWKYENAYIPSCIFDTTVYHLASQEKNWNGEYFKNIWKICWKYILERALRGEKLPTLNDPASNLLEKTRVRGRISEFAYFCKHMIDIAEDEQSLLKLLASFLKGEILEIQNLLGICCNLPKSPLNAISIGEKNILENLQGNILKSHGRNHSQLVFIRFQSHICEKARHWLAEFSRAYVVSALTQKQHAFKRKTATAPEEHEFLFVSALLSATGYRKLGLGAALPGDQNFQNGMKNQTNVAVGLLPVLEVIGDVVDNNLHLQSNPLQDPPVGSWESFFQSDVDALLVFAAGEDYGGKGNGQRELAKLVQSIVTGHDFTAIVEEHNIEEGNVIREKNVAKPRPLEHFGHPDGISQPLFLQDDVDEYKKANNIHEDQNFASFFNPITPLNEVLVYDAVGQRLDTSNRNAYHLGSYFVYRKLEQDVERYNKLLSETAATLLISVENLDAQIVGRDKQGIPLVKRTSGPNNFDFGDDIGGQICPFHAHIRKTNPRISDENPTDTSQRAFLFQGQRQIVRRGVTYGPEYAVNPKANRGLHFLCANANIAEQFVFMQVIRCNNVNFQKKHTGIDPIIGQSINGKNTAQNWVINDKERKYLFDEVVKMKGGEYFFAPALNTLHDLDKFS